MSSDNTTPPTANDDEIKYLDILAAEHRIRPFIKTTPLLIKTALSEMSGFTKGLFFKCENLQTTGSFKIRGSMNAVVKHLNESSSASSSNEDKKPTATTFVSHSSGNHAQALARAAKMNDQKSHIVVPQNAPQAKVDAMRENGAEIYFCEPNLAAREAGVKHLIEEVYGPENATFIHPYDHPDVIAGQGTCGLEIAQQFPTAFIERNKLDPSLISSAYLLDPSITRPVFITPIGGGGLTSGVSIALRCQFPNALIIGAEPLEADDASRSFVSGKIEPLRQTPPPTIADGLMTTLSERTLGIIRKNVDFIVTVTEDEIARAMKEVYQRLKLVIEPSAGVPAAVALFKREEIIKRSGGDGSNLDSAVCILCGGNVDLIKLGQIIAGIKQ